LEHLGVLCKSPLKDRDLVGLVFSFIAEHSRVLLKLNSKLRNKDLGRLLFILQDSRVFRKLSLEELDLVLSGFFVRLKDATVLLEFVFHERDLVLVFAHLIAQHGRILVHPCLQLLDQDLGVVLLIA